MQPRFFRFFLVLTLLIGVLRAAPIQAAPRQIVVVIADGIGAPMVDLGRNYLRVAQQEPQLSGALDTLQETPVGATASPDRLRDWLQNATRNGFKTGLVTTGDITREAAFYGSPTAKRGSDFDFLGGGGRANLALDAGEKIRARGGTFLSSTAGLDGEIAGRVVAAQAENDLDFALDRDPSQQAGIGELAALALDTLGANDASFVLVIHETLLQKALESKDTPALFAEFGELNALINGLETRRAANPDLKFAVWLTGSAASPRFTSPDAAQQRQTLEKLAGFSLSYAGAGRALQGANPDEIADFFDARNGQYPGLTLAIPTIEQIVAGTINPETALRDAAQPLLQIAFDGPVAAPLIYTGGLETRDGFWAALN